MSTAVENIAAAPEEADHNRTERLFAAQQSKALSLRTSTAAERIEKLKPKMVVCCQAPALPL